MQIIDTNCEVLERPGLLDVSKCLLEVLQLNINLVSSLLSLGNLYCACTSYSALIGPESERGTYSLDLEGLDSLDMRTNVVGDGLEVLQELLGLVNDSLVFENSTIVIEVDSGGLAVELSVYPLRVRVALAEGLESSDGLCRDYIEFNIVLL